MRVMWNNLIDSATLSCLTENPNYPLTNLQEAELSSLYKTVGSSDEYIVIDCWEAIAASRFAILGSNLTESAVITLQANSADSWTSPAFSETVTWVDGYPIIHKFTEISYRYWRLVVTDSTLSEISIARLFLGTFLQLPPMKQDQSLEDETTREAVMSDSGRVFPGAGYEFHKASVNFPYLTLNEKTGIREMFASVRNNIPVVVCVWDDLVAWDEPFYAIIDQKNIAFKRNEKTRVYPFSTTIKFRQVF